MPSLEAYLLDQDELDEALNGKIITQEQYDLACNTAEKLMNDIISEKQEIMKRYKSDLEYMIKLVK